MAAGLVAAIRDSKLARTGRKAVEDGWVLPRVRNSEVEEPQKGPNRVAISQSQPSKS